ncbi:hypothetical protein GLW36_16560 [Halorubrum terrestre]|uniref:HNH nuclease domain-containing protein n=1 Tax=Halorubrum distributum TaxID=29283 RepID=A0A6B1IG31_9EURY|nr:HNH endonuclease [Halorubrum terrestre]MYL18239.1 hypothetical protein [Halorubrum terrestre]
MADDQAYRVDIKESAFEENEYIRRLLEFPDGDLDTERLYSSEESAQLEVTRFNELGEKELRLQTAEHDSTDFHAFIVSTGKSTRGYGRTTRNATSGWQKARKIVLERDDFECQKCSTVGGPEGHVELHVDHIEPQSAGGSDDPENLRTLCRECHMEIHGSTPRGEPASVGEIVEAIDELAGDSYIPAFLRWKLRSLVTDKVDMRVRFKSFEEAIDSLIRYDRFSQINIRGVEKVQLVNSEETRKSEYKVIYDESIIDDPSLFSHEDGLVYDRETLHGGQISDEEVDQTGLTDFM